MILETTFPAHIRSSDGQAAVVQTCEQHSRNAASFAAASLQYENLFHSALLAGLVHDMGKYKPAFRSYIEQAAAGNSPRKGSVIHTFAGVRYLLERFHTRESAMDYADIAAEILAYAAGAHHGLFDIFDASGACGFLHRLQTGDSDDLDAMQNFCAQCASESELNRLFHRSVAEIKAALEICQGLAKSEEEFLFYAGLLVRLLCSAVIDGDRRDTAMFMNNAVFPDGADSRLWERLSEKLAEKLRQFRTDSPINQTRRRISDLCNDSAPNRPGIYRLHIPTGGGKTLSSLRYALAHAAQYRKKRIIFTFPLLSIIEQNSAVLRDAIGDDSIVLEHYSNVVSGETGSPDETARREQLIDSWDAPIIITTLVQLLNTLFDAKTACIRRFHALTGSVIVIDEVQTVPYHMLTLFNLALTFLAEICHATVILCSATQPCTEQIAHPIGCTVRDLICCDEPMRSVFRRTELIDAGSYRLGEIPAFAEEVLRGVDSLLIVCNKKAEARALYAALRSDAYNVFHLSAGMCTAHRKQALSALYASLKTNQRKTVCVSTQVIEAGVDISFGAVIRFTAGMDSIIQAAGRCNRNGELRDLAPVYIVRCQDERLSAMPELRMAKQATEELLHQFRQFPDKFDRDLSSDAAIRSFYTSLFFIQKRQDRRYHDDPVPGEPSLFELLSANERWRSETVMGPMQFYLPQAFKSAGQRFSVFGEETVDVIVPFQEGASIMERLAVSSEFSVQKALLRQAKEYTVALYAYQIDLLQKQNALQPLLGGGAIALKNPCFYDATTGFLEEGNGSCDILIL